MNIEMRKGIAARNDDIDARKIFQQGRKRALHLEDHARATPQQ